VGLLAAAGHAHVRVVRRPVVAVAAVGDELMPPGAPPARGKLYASNMVSLRAWCRRYRWPVHAAMVGDDSGEIERILDEGIERSDAMITTGGAWTGDRDRVVAVLRRLGWRQVFRTLRMAPGKGVGFGWLREKPVFVLPGGPPAAMVGFVQMALPALLKLGGHHDTGLPRIEARLSADLTGRQQAWTRFVFGRLTAGESARPRFDPMPRKRRLVTMAEADALAAIPEGVRKLPAGSTIRVQLLT
jgi:molybdopterin molybdotransferase